MKIFQFVIGRMIVPVSMKVRSISSNGGGHALVVSMVIEVWMSKNTCIFRHGGGYVIYLKKTMYFPFVLILPRLTLFDI